MPEIRNSIANAMELRLSCTYPSICNIKRWLEFEETEYALYNDLASTDTLWVSFIFFQCNEDRKLSKVDCTWNRKLLCTAIFCFLCLLCSLRLSRIASGQVSDNKNVEEKTIFLILYRWLNLQTHLDNDVIMSAFASPTTSLTIIYQPFIQAQIKENIKAPRHWPLWWEFTSHRGIPRTKGL